VGRTHIIVVNVEFEVSAPAADGNGSIPIAVLLTQSSTKRHGFEGQVTGLVNGDAELGGAEGVLGGQAGGAAAGAESQHRGGAGSWGPACGGWRQSGTGIGAD
jgi:hypothetical protein